MMPIDDGPQDFARGVQEKDGVTSSHACASVLSGFNVPVAPVKRCFLSHPA
jgi:hypothetical protein